MTDNLDVTVQNHGSIVLVFPETDNARNWIHTNVRPEGWMFFAGGLAFEPRFLGDLLMAMALDGLATEGEGHEMGDFAIAVIGAAASGAIVGVFAAACVLWLGGGF